MKTDSQTGLFQRKGKKTVSSNVHSLRGTSLNMKVFRLAQAYLLGSGSVLPFRLFTATSVDNLKASG